MLLGNIAQNSVAAVERNDIELLLRIVQPEKPKIVMDIGLNTGESAKVWINAFGPELFIGMDINQRPNNAVEIRGENIHYLWNSDSRNPFTIEKVKNILGGRQIDFIFIDGSHYYEHVLGDWDIYSKLVKEGGIIAFHDILYVIEHCNVKKLWEGLKKEYFYVEIVSGDASTGLGIIFNTKIGNNAVLGK